MPITGLETTRGHMHGATPELDAEKVRLARLAVASAAHDAQDCAQLLDALGLLKLTANEQG